MLLLLQRLLRRRHLRFRLLNMRHMVVRIEGRLILLLAGAGRSDAAITAAAAGRQGGRPAVSLLLLSAVDVGRIDRRCIGQRQVLLQFRLNDRVSDGLLLLRLRRWRVCVCVCVGHGGCGWLMGGCSRVCRSRSRLGAAQWHGLRPAVMGNVSPAVRPSVRVVRRRRVSGWLRERGRGRS